MTESPRASTLKLQPGESTIDRSTPTMLPNGSVRLTWSFRPVNGAKSEQYRNVGPTIGVAKRKAKDKFEQLLRGGPTLWKPTSSLAQYIEEVSKPKALNRELSDRSHRDYADALKLLVGTCSKHPTAHTKSAREHTIASGTTYRGLESILREIGELHGYNVARRVRTVLNAYVLQELRRDELIPGNPIYGVELADLIGVQRAQRQRGGKALPEKQYRKALTYLLGRDPAEGVVRKQGVWTLEQKIQKVRNALDVTLMQAATGLRRYEANHVRWSSLQVNKRGIVTIFVPKEIAKNKQARTVIVLDARVGQRLLARRDERGSDGYIIGNPTDPNRPWDQSNCDKATKLLYLELFEKLEIDMFETERSHSWRTTLLAIYLKRNIPNAVLDLQFGNSEDVRKKHYVDNTETEPMEDIADHWHDAEASAKTKKKKTKKAKRATA